MPFGRTMSVITASTAPVLRIDPVDMAGADLAFGLVALIVGLDAVGGIGEPDRAVGLHHHVVRRIEALALPAVGDGDDRAVMLGAADAAAGMLAGDQPALAVDRVAVANCRKAARKTLTLPSVSS